MLNLTAGTVNPQTQTAGSREQAERPARVPEQQVVIMHPRWNDPNSEDYSYLPDELKALDGWTVLQIGADPIVLDQNASFKTPSGIDYFPCRVMDEIADALMNGRQSRHRYVMLKVPTPEGQPDKVAFFWPRMTNASQGKQLRGTQFFMSGSPVDMRQSVANDTHTKYNSVRDLIANETVGLKTRGQRVHTRHQRYTRRNGAV